MGYENRIFHVKSIRINYGTSFGENFGPARVPEGSTVHFDEATRRQVAFTTIRELNKKLSYFDELQSHAPRPLPDQAASHVSSLPFSPPKSYLRPGTFLLSHPTMNDSYFGRSVICILEHNDETMLDSSASKRNQTPGQTYGIIVNRVSYNSDTGKNRSLTEAFEQHMLPGKIAEIFGDSVVREGGPVHVAIQMLYGVPGFNDTSKVMSDIGGSLIPTIPEAGSSPSLYSDEAIYAFGDIFKAVEAVDAGKLDPGTIFHGINSFLDDIVHLFYLTRHSCNYFWKFAFFFL